MHVKILLSQLLASFLVSVCQAFLYANPLDKPMLFQCPHHQYVYYIGGYHANYEEDRQYQFKCKGVPADQRDLWKESCSWTGYVNDFDDPITFQCSGNRYIAGVNSYHEDYYEDRRFNFYCCYIPGYHMINCQYSGYVNGYDERMDHTIPYGKVLRGAASHHDR